MLRKNDSGAWRFRVFSCIQFDRSDGVGDSGVGFLCIHGLHDIKRVIGEPAGEASMNELVKHGAAKGLVVLLDLIVAPCGQVAHSVVNCVEPVGANKGDCIREDCSAN